MHYIAHVRKGDRLRLSVAALDDDAAGVALHQGMRIHVAGALPEEEVEATVAHVSPHRPDAWAALDAVLQASPARVEPVCPAYGPCGGCTLEHLDYAGQLAFKRGRVLNELAKVPELAALTVGDCVASPRPLGYRNKHKLVYARDAHGLPLLGAYAPRSHEVVDLGGCQVAEPALDIVAAALRGLCQDLRVRAYDERLGEGVLRYAVLRANAAGQVLATLVTATAEFAEGATLARALTATELADGAQVVGVVQNINSTRGNALWGDRDVTLAGQGYLEERIGPVKLHLSPTAFLQVNRELAARLYADLLAQVALAGRERVVDCYAGVGGIALTLAPHAAEVIGIEEHARAVADAQVSAELNGAKHARFVAGDAAARLLEVERADLVVLNPPRRGCAPAVLDACARLSPERIAYVSCAPETLVRDLALLRAKGYVTRAVTPYDMLPQTPHVEALAILTRA
jgi:23S rRNA (uracil1939-C5)-methyltransferase